MRAGEHEHQPRIQYTIRAEPQSPACVADCLSLQYITVHYGIILHYCRNSVTLTHPTGCNTVRNPGCLGVMFTLLYSRRPIKQFFPPLWIKHYTSSFPTHCYTATLLHCYNLTLLTNTYPLASFKSYCDLLQSRCRPTGHPPSNLSLSLSPRLYERDFFLDGNFHFLLFCVGDAPTPCPPS